MDSKINLPKNGGASATTGVDDHSQPGVNPQVAQSKGKCSVCHKDSNLVCSGCQSTSYCSVEHQKKHWKVHKLSCVFFHVRDDPSEFTGGGKYCVSSRDLNAGTVLLEELPAFQMPVPASEPITNPRCITCGVTLPPVGLRNALNSCRKCNWPVCGAACADASIHASNECKVFVANQIPFPKVMPSLPAVGLGVYPLLMRIYAFMVQNAQPWEHLMEMLDWINDIKVRDASDSFFRTPESRSLAWYAFRSSKTDSEFSSVPTLFPKICDEDHTMLNILLRKMFRLCCTQGYQYFADALEHAPPRTDHSFTPIRNFTYIYEKARHFVHSCSPNCEWTIGKFPHFKMYLRTASPVKKGEKLTVSRCIYIPEFDKGTKQRQEIFRNFFDLPCRCDLCLDRTEFGTYQSALVCKFCEKQNTASYLLPLDPLNIDDDAPWKCIKCKKVSTVPVSVSHGKLVQVTMELQDKLKNNIRSAEKCCEAAIEKYRKLVHPNHWAIQFAVKLIRQCQLPRLQTMAHGKTDDLLKLEKLMMFLLDCKDKTVPGILVERIVIVSAACIAMSHRMKLIKKSKEDINAMSAEYLRSLQATLQKCLEYQNDVLLYYKYPPNKGNAYLQEYLDHVRGDIQAAKSFLNDIDGRLVEIGIQHMDLEVSTN